MSVYGPLGTTAALRLVDSSAARRERRQRFPTVLRMALVGRRSAGSVRAGRPAAIGRLSRMATISTSDDSGPRLCENAEAHKSCEMKLRTTSLFARRHSRRSISGALHASSHLAKSALTRFHTASAQSRHQRRRPRVLDASPCADPFRDEDKAAGFDLSSSSCLGEMRTSSRSPIRSISGSA